MNAEQFEAITGRLNTAARVAYDNDDSGLEATNVQAAIDEVAASAGGGGGAGGVEQFDVQLAHADITALPTAGFEVLPAPGAGYAWELWAIYLLADIHTPYTNVGAQLGLQVYGAMGGTLQVPVTGSVMFATEDTVSAVMARGKFVATEPELRYPTGYDATPVTLAAFNSEDGDADLGDFEDGDAANTLSVRVFASKVPAAPFGAA